MELQKKIDALKYENDQDNQRLVELANVRQKLFQEVLVRNGRILALQELLKEKGEEQE